MLVLGTLSGLLAGFLYMAISIPLVVLAVDQEDRTAVAKSQFAAETIERLIEQDAVLSDDRIAELGLSWVSVQVRYSGTHLYVYGEPDPRTLGATACEPGTADMVQAGGEDFAVACIITPTHLIATGLEPIHTLGAQILNWTLTLAIVVGIVTAWGQSRLLSPLTQMAHALERVGRGERDVHVADTGLREFDEVVARINEAAGHVEERVDAITARMTVVQEMARMVAHEVRNPLQSLELLTSLVAREQDPKERLEIANAIHQEILGLDQVVHRLLKEGATVGALRLRRRKHSAAELVTQIARLYQASAQKRGIRLSIGLVSHQSVTVDGAMLGRSIENLVINAMHAVSDGIGEIRLSVFVDKDRLYITVDDNGPGVDEAIGNAIFDRNVTGKATGHGLGLALVRAVIMAHDGTIEYSRSPMGGARFQASIPLEGPQEDA